MNPTIRPCLLAVLLQACALSSAPSAAVRPGPTPSASELFARGMQLAARGDALRAEQYLLLARRAGHPEQRVIVPLVRVCIASSRLRAALGHAEPFLRRHPETWQLRYLTAAIHLALERPAEALGELRRILRARPDAAQAHYLMAVTLRDGLGDADGAQASFERYLRHAPRGEHAREALSWLAERTRLPVAGPTPLQELVDAEPAP
jgi:tetratricopeptide (TPR) repeat protein